MDDFGTGHSSLGYLCSFPFDKIKINQSFIRNLATKEDSIAIVRAVVELGSSLGIIHTTTPPKALKPGSSSSRLPPWAATKFRASCSARRVRLPRSSGCWRNCARSPWRLADPIGAWRHLRSGIRPVGGNAWRAARAKFPLRARCRAGKGTAHGRRHPLQQDARPCARHGRRDRARPAPGDGEQSEPVHLQGHDELHHRPRPGRHRRSRPRRSSPYRRAARCRAQRDGDGDLRHPHPSRPFAGGAGGEGGDRRHRLCRGAAPRRPAAAYRRAQSARRQRRPRFPPRRRAQGRRGGHRRRLDRGGGDHARPHRQPHGFRLARTER